MKYFLITIIFLTLSTACSYQNAFSKFNMSNEEELIESNTRSSKIENKSGVIGVLQAIYINNTDKVYFDNEEHFLITVYLKDHQQHKYTFKLNKQPPLKVKELTDVKQYTTYIKDPKKWEKHYIVTFKKSTKKLNLTFESNGDNLSELYFQKY
jgi:hypothetical protein